MTCNSTAVKVARDSTGNTSPRPCRNAATCRWTPLSSQNSHANLRNSCTLSGVTVMSTPFSQSSAPPVPVSRKQPTEMYSVKEMRGTSLLSTSLECKYLAPNSSALHNSWNFAEREAWSTLRNCASVSSRKSATTPTNSPESPSPVRGNALLSSGIPCTSLKKSLVSGKGVKNPSRSAFPIRRPRKRNRLSTTGQLLKSAGRGLVNSPLRDNKKGSSTPLSSTHMGTALFTSRSCNDLQISL
mmetsp:Transcript_15651/g.34510  ORF Transcript_15651/g.34510 Transcript_15651/m.34510 type:complete len:242 (-) Transcript_15651:1619-2344(-)